MTKEKSSKEYDRYYVYALIDPATKIPFYIGKGSFNRLAAHFSEQNLNVTFNNKNGVLPDEILDFLETNEKENKKIEKINDLKIKGFTAKDIARVVARNLNEKTALAIEGLLIKNIYGKNQLSNIVDGHHTERFREKNNWKYIENFDLKKDNNGNFLSDESSNYYVYVLINPENNKIFYIGKGKGKRLCDHFNDAKNNGESSSKKLDEIVTLLNKNYKPCDIGRVIARVESEDMAFMIESFYIKFFIGFKHLHNVQPGQLSELFRAYEDWEIRAGFDIPIIIEKRQERKELLDIFLSEDLDLELNNVASRLREIDPNLAFSEPRVMNAGELVILSSIPSVNVNIKLRIQIRSARRFQVILYPSNSAGKKWMKEHFSRLNAFPLKRQDNWLIPEPWRVNNVTDDIELVVERCLELIKLAKIHKREELNELEYLLASLPYNRTGK
jgi:hypothetical protein